MVGYLFQNYILSIQRTIYICNQSIYIFNLKLFTYSTKFIFNENLHLTRYLYSTKKFTFNQNLHLTKNYILTKKFTFNEKIYIQRKFTLTKIIFNAVYRTGLFQSVKLCKFEKSKWKQGLKIRHYNWLRFYIISNYYFQKLVSKTF